MTINDSITKVKGVGPAIADKLRVLSITTVRDAIYNFPRRYDDYSEVVDLKNIQPGAVTVKVQVEKVTARHVRRGLHITEAILSDDQGKIRAVWFNQSYRAESLKAAKEFYMSGLFEFQRDRFVLQNPTVEKVGEFVKNTARIVPIYRETKGLKSFLIRKVIAELLPLMKMLPETLPKQIVQSEQLMPLAAAVCEMHFPKDKKTLAEAKKRLAFEELFELLLAAQLNKNEHQAVPAWAIPFSEQHAKQFTQTLPFAMTDAQRRAAWEIIQDITNEQPMNRILQGDVGSGKTAVAAFAAFMAHAQQMQAAFMAPTEVLATQHANSLATLLEPLGVEVGLLVGSVKQQAKKALLKAVAQGDVGIVVGTHALIQDTVEFARLGLVVVDEQHRFGVLQRNTLLKQGERMPHILSMTATPIPRSMALTVYGELDVSILDELPANRLPIITEICSPHSRDTLYKKVDAEIENGRQVYVVCPLVSDSDKLGVKSVEAEHQHLQQTVFKHRKIGLLHGKLTGEQKETIMRDFKARKYDILVATTVVEVGVDVPNATIMIIEGAERFGLAQLHQLRGRVGRGEHQSYCYLIPSTAQKPSRRLREVANSNDGFYLAEVDLEIRGPGEIYGRRQHGVLDLKIANITDVKLIHTVQKAVQRFMQSDEDLLQYPQLYERVQQLRRVTILN